MVNRCYLVSRRLMFLTVFPQFRHARRYCSLFRLFLLLKNQRCRRSLRERAGQVFVFFRHYTMTEHRSLGTVEITAKNTADFCENRKNHGKDRASNHEPKNHYTVYKIQHLALLTIITCSARFSSV